MSKENTVDREIVREFHIIKADLVSRLQQMAGQEGNENGISMDVAGGSDEVTLALGSDGSWRGVIGTHDWLIGKNPPMDKLLSIYALADGDERYTHDVIFELATRGKAGRFNDYLEKHRDELLSGLIGDMAELLDELTPFVDDRKTGLMAV